MSALLLTLMLAGEVHVPEPGDPFDGVTKMELWETAVRFETKLSVCESEVDSERVLRAKIEKIASTPPAKESGISVSAVELILFGAGMALAGGTVAWIATRDSGGVTVIDR